MRLRRRKIYHLDPDGLVVLLRRNGIGAYVEFDNGDPIVVALASERRIRKVCRDNDWVAPAFAAGDGPYPCQPGRRN